MEEFPSGHVLSGRFRIASRLGKGGMGSVYVAEEMSTGASVALKVLSSELVEDARFVERFRREAEATARLEHPNIVRVTEFVHLPGEPALIVMERLRGEPLLAHVRRGPMAPKNALSIAGQLTAALGAAHRAGVVHRDLKPANVFLVPLAHGGSLVKLLDFGIAKLRESDGYKRLTQTGVLIGTPRYASPEQVMGSKDIDARSDVFSLGVLLYGMLAGRPPFPQKGAALLVAIRHEVPPPLESVAGVSPVLAAVVETAMAKRPEERFRSMEAFETALQSASVSDRPSVPAATLIDRAPVLGSTPAAPSGPGPHAPSAPATREFQGPPVSVPRTPTRGTPRQPLPRVELGAPGIHAAPDGRPSRTSAPLARVSRPSGPDGTVYGLRGSAPKNAILPRILMWLGGLLVALAVLGLAFVGAGFWFRGRDVERASPQALQGGASQAGERGDWLPGVDYLPSRAAVALGFACQQWEHQECACRAIEPAEIARCHRVLSAIRDAAASDVALDCSAEVVPSLACVRPLFVTMPWVEPGSPQWNNWAALQASHMGPSCSTLLERTCGCDRVGTADCIDLQGQLFDASTNDALRARLFEQCRQVPDFEVQSCE